MCIIYNMCNMCKCYVNITCVNCKASLACFATSQAELEACNYPYVNAAVIRGCQQATRAATQANGGSRPDLA